MAKDKTTIERDCSLCNLSIKQNDKLYCKNKIFDLTRPFTVYSEVKTKIDCGYYKEKK